MRNYVANLRTLGFTDGGLAGRGNDRLIGALVPSGDPMAVAAALTAHLTAGADQVVLGAVQVVRPRRARTKNPCVSCHMLPIVLLWDGW